MEGLVQDFLLYESQSKLDASSERWAFSGGDHGQLQEVGQDSECSFNSYR